MDEPVIAGKEPKVMEVPAGTHYWCSCGKSKNQPFCDGSHKGTGMQPIAFVIDEKKEVALCMCKRSENAPYCDGTHSKL